MADMDGWNLGLIAAPAAGDRVIIATGPGTGGYSPRGDFVHKSAGGFLASGLENAPYNFSSSLVVENQSFVGGSVAGFLGKTGDTTNGFAAFVRTGGYGGKFSIGLNDGSGPNALLERLTILSDGNVGIGTASPGARLHVKSSGEIMRLETTTVRGSGANYLGFNDPTGLKGYVGYGGGNDVLYVANSTSADVQILAGSYGVVCQPDGDFRPSTSGGGQNLGKASNKWATVYAVTGTINTCDIRLKFYRADPAPTDDEHAAALECFEVFGFFQHLDAIAREEDGGSPARWHFGPKAQEVWAIFAGHGLAAPLGEDGLPPEGSVPPAFLCFDAWDEETAPILAWWKPSAILGPDGEPLMVPCAEGEEGTVQRPTGETYVTREAGNIFGIRIDQLQSLLLVALNKERLAQAAAIADYDERIQALEAAA